MKNNNFPSRDEFTEELNSVGLRSSIEDKIKYLQDLRKKYLNYSGIYMGIIPLSVNISILDVEIKFRLNKIDNSIHNLKLSCLPLKGKSKIKIRQKFEFYIEWTDSNRMLISLITSLIKNKLFLNCKRKDSKKIINQLFILKENDNSKNHYTKQIKWGTNNTLIPYLFDCLFLSNKISHSYNENLFAFIEEHFVNKKGGVIKNNVLCNSVSANGWRIDKTKKPKNHKTIDSIIKKCFDENHN